MRRACVVLSVVLLALVGLSPPATAATVRGQWGMRPVHGIVDDVTGTANLHLVGGWTNVAGAVGRAVRFRWTGRPAAAVVHGGATFNPGVADFAVAVYLKAEKVPATGGYSPNVVQKGHFDDRGPVEDGGDPYRVRDGRAVPVLRYPRASHGDGSHHHGAQRQQVAQGDLLAGHLHLRDQCRRCPDDCARHRRRPSPTQSRSEWRPRARTPGSPTSSRGPSTA